MEGAERRLLALREQLDSAASAVLGMAQVYPVSASSPEAEDPLRETLDVKALSR